jgi:hypothetical protein
MAREATQFRKGQSGNPGGRPKTRLISDAMLKALVKREAVRGQTNAERIAETAVREAANGDVQWVKVVLSYVEGLPVQPMEHSGPDGETFTLRIVRPHGDSPATD